MTDLQQRPHTPPTPPLIVRIQALLPGVTICLLAAGISFGASRLLPGVSPLIIAIVLGILVANIFRLPESLSRGVDFSAKKLLRIGIVFLGLQLALTDIIDLGAPMLLVVVCVVAGGFCGTIALGRLLHVRPELALLIGCGFSICGAAAVAGAAGVTDPNGEAEEDTITAVALVVIFGTLMIAVVPLASSALGLDARTAGMWAGGSIQEIAQVVAVGGIIGGGALTVAVIVKLARVLLLAPMVAALSVHQRRIRRTSTSSAPGVQQAKLPPIIPAFIIAFSIMVLMRSFVPLPAFVLAGGQLLQTVLLGAAMFGLGTGVKVRNLARVGLRPFALAALSTLLVATIAGVGIALAG